MSIIFVAIFFCQFANAQTQATLLGVWDDPELIGSNNYDNTYNEVWGIAVNGKEFGVIGSTAGTHIIDLNGDEPFELFLVQGKSSGGQIIHRDFKEYKGFLYAVADEGVSSLQIIDVRCLPDKIEVVYDSSALINRAHNIFIDTSQARLYAFATRNGANQSFAMRIYSLEDPTLPVFIAEHKVFGGNTVGHVHDGWVDNHLALLNCGGDGFFIVDFTNPLVPILKDKITTYPDRGYNHSGYPTKDLQYFYMADENHGFDLKVVDISDVENATVVGTFNAGVENPFSITHNQIAHCNYLYTSYYYDGLRVFDISDPENPEPVLYYDTYSFQNGNSYKGAWGVYPFLPSGKILISDMQTGLYIFDAIDAECEGRVINVEASTTCLTSSVNENLLSEIQMYPNPILAGKALTISLPIEVNQIKLMDINGKLIEIWNTDNSFLQTLDIATVLESGFYILALNTINGQQWVKPLVVN
jgi:choice-of-anchor B domain-containing protein